MYHADLHKQVFIVIPFCMKFKCFSMDSSQLSLVFLESIITYFGFIISCFNMIALYTLHVSKEDRTMCQHFFSLLVMFSLCKFGKIFITFRKIPYLKAHHVINLNHIELYTMIMLNVSNSIIELMTFLTAKFNFSQVLDFSMK